MRGRGGGRGSGRKGFGCIPSGKVCDMSLWLYCKQPQRVFFQFAVVMVRGYRSIVGLFCMCKQLQGMPGGRTEGRYVCWRKVPAKCAYAILACLFL